MIRVRFIEYAPWLLGWCRWELRLEENSDDDPVTHRRELGYGVWQWRGRRAEYRETMFEVA